jgi:penicillin G amidase
MDTEASSEPRLTQPAIKPATRRRRKWLRRLLYIPAMILLCVLAIGAAGILWMRHAMFAALPVIDGSLQLPGLSAPVTVIRDTHGVPQIEAATQDDLLIAQGFITAQDRLWQMDVLRRNASGNLAEIIGPSALDHDKSQRILQFRNVADRVYRSLPEADRHRYEQYAAGVNVFIAQNIHHLPAEFRLLHYRPQPWTGADSVLIGLNMVQTLDTHWYAKLMRERVARLLHDPRLEADLYPTGSWRDQPPTAAVADMTQPRPTLSPDDEDTDQTETRNTPPALPATMSPNPAETPEILSRILGLPNCGNSRSGGCIPGSNNWVIAGKHTAGGKPLLASDMHLGLSVPNIWYMADLKAPGLHVAGVTLPGMPLVIAGRNEHIAWGFTALYADVQDLYVEKLDGKGNYAGPGGQWLPLAHATETIHVRFSPDVTLDVQLTAHGPLLTPILKHETRPIALHWTLYDPALAAIPLYEINTAADWQHFSSAMTAWCWPTQNAVYADDQGHIAYHAIGKVPMRPAGLVGKLIYDGQHEWQGYIPYDEMPYSVDPRSGLLATANARVTPNDTKFPLTLEWPDPYRAERVYMDLRGRGNLTRDDMLQVQTDIYSELDHELAHRFAYAIDQVAQTARTAHTATVDVRLLQAANILRTWDGRMTTDSAAASIVFHARKALWPLILDPKLGADAEAYDWAESNYAEEEIVMHGSPASSDPAAAGRWLPKGYKDWDALLTEAVRRGIDQGKAPADLSHWSYGSWHVVDLEHPILAMLPVVKDWSGTGELPLSGDTVTVKQSGRAFGPSQRFTMDWSAPDASTENIVLGESGNPMSPWFRDQWPAWYGGTTFPLPFSTVNPQPAHTLQLVP